MRARAIVIDEKRMPGTRFTVALTCPKLLEGHEFYACRCESARRDGDRVAAIDIKCEYVDSFADGHVVCAHGCGRREVPQAQFGIPTVAHATLQQEEHDGSTCD